MKRISALVKLNSDFILPIFLKKIKRKPLEHSLLEYFEFPEHLILFIHKYTEKEIFFHLLWHHIMETKSKTIKKDQIIELNNFCTSIALNRIDDMKNTYT